MTTEYKIDIVLKEGAIQTRNSIRGIILQGKKKYKKMKVIKGLRLRNSSMRGFSKQRGFEFSKLSTQLTRVCCG